MILAKGKLYGEEEREVLLARLEDEINETRVRAPLRSETVIAALDALGRHTDSLTHNLLRWGFRAAQMRCVQRPPCCGGKIWNTVCTWNWECTWGVSIR